MKFPSAMMTGIAANKVRDLHAERRGWEVLASAGLANEMAFVDPPYAAATLDEADALAGDIAELGGVTPRGVELFAAG